MRVYPLLALVATCVLFTGCARKFTYERFSMIQPGTDDREDVRHMLGQPRFDAADEWYYEDLHRHVAARVFFDDDDRVTQKEWMDAKRGTWQGRHPAADEPPAGEVRERSMKTRRVDKD